MSKIKGWRKVKEDKISGITWSRIDYPIVYVQIHETVRREKGVWKVTGTRINQKYFKTKVQAFKYVIDWMKRHP